MNLTPSSIGQKLLIAFSMMAGLMIIAVVIGVAGFSLVAKTEKTVINAAVPALVEARQLSDLSTVLFSMPRFWQNQKMKKSGISKGNR